MNGKGDWSVDEEAVSFSFRLYRTGMNLMEESVLFELDFDK